jgi:translation elongation factor P/translation initiation factor 5A
MAQGDVLKKYSSWTALTVTDLQGLAASSTHVGGWESDVIDNSSTGYDDIRITAKITLESAGLGAGQIRMGCVALLDDTTYPLNFDGTESAESPFFSDTEMQAGYQRVGAFVDTDTGASDVYYLEIPSVKWLFLGNLPPKFVVTISHSTTAALETSGNVVSWIGSYYNVAPS